MKPNNLAGLAERGAAPLSAYKLDDQALLRRIVVAGRAALLRVDELPGFVFARMAEHGDPGVTMPAGTVVVEVWVESWALELRGRVAKALAGLHADFGARGVLVVPVVRPAGRWHRLRASVRWWAWRVFDRGGER